MINNFLVINCIGKDDKLGLRINKDFFVHKIAKGTNMSEKLVSEILHFLNMHNVELDNKFSILINQGPGSFSSIRISLAIAKGLEILKKTKLYGFKNADLKGFNLKNIEELFNKKLVEKKLIKPIYFS